MGHPSQTAAHFLVRPWGVCVDFPRIKRGESRAFDSRGPLVWTDYYHRRAGNLTLLLQLISLMMLLGSGIAVSLLTEFLWFQILQIILMAVGRSSSFMFSTSLSHLSIGSQPSLKKLGIVDKLGKKKFHTTFELLHNQNRCSPDSALFLHKKQKRVSIDALS